MKTSSLRKYGTALATLLLLDLGASAAASAAPWRLDQAAGLPDWLSVDGSYRLRYQVLDNPPRAGASGTDNLLDERLLLNAKADLGAFYLDAELEDARTQLDDAGTPLGTDDVNTLELLRAFVGVKKEGVFQAGDSLDVQAGRITMDVGSRRFVARNRFRNTINAFTGVNGVWTSADKLRLQAFFTLPITREPTSRADLDDNDVAFDKETFKTYFWGLDASQKKFLGNLNGEVYVLGLHEGDHRSIQTKNRRLITPGFRLFTDPAPGAWDFEVEGDLQFGKTRATTSPADTTDLDKFAGFAHVLVARTLQAPWSPRLVFQYDYASGDSNPGDNDDNQFDTLFGARRSEFGPTGIYGALARANISSPGARVEVKPTSALDAFVGYRAAWLASNQDSLTTAGLKDATGHSGSFVGHQIEARVRYTLLPGNLAFDIGGAYLIHGKFLKDAPNAPDGDNSTYFYASTTVTF